MSAHVKLVDTQFVPGGIRVPTVACQVGDATYEFVAPGHRVGKDVVVRPALEVVEDSSVQIRFDKWQVHHEALSAVLPLTLRSVSVAVQAAREFHDDQGISWDSPDAEIWSWSMAFAERVNAGGGR
ncbi:hypothetical protein GCM10025787_03260 [Saccharopolyspora rosea]|uniref:Uncharacterized protein n=1 Tax=Saccharopolyspora rosea TaxID=524884 RepID=A0ABW3FPE3_9PSEU